MFEAMTLPLMFSVDGLPYLHKLLVRGKTGSIPRALGMLEALHLLNLSENSLTGEMMLKHEHLICVCITRGPR